MSRTVRPEIKTQQAAITWYQMLLARMDTLTDQLTTALEKAERDKTARLIPMRGRLCEQLIDARNLFVSICEDPKYASLKQSNPNDEMSQSLQSVKMEVDAQCQSILAKQSHCESLLRARMDQNRIRLGTLRRGAAVHRAYASTTGQSAGLPKRLDARL
jgi:hypothetical protein